MTIDVGTTDRILAVLSNIEQEHGVRVLLAVESGSRSWGFESHDSDYDVRFVYAHPLDWYISIQQRPDTIRLPFDGVRCKYPSVNKSLLFQRLRLKMHWR